MFNLEGKVALITGSAQGIGEGIARKLSANGAKIVFSDVNLEKLQATAATIPGSLHLKMDVTNPAEVEAGVARIEKEWGRLDILVNNAGGGGGGKHNARVNIDTFSIEQWDLVVRLNLTGVFLVSRAASQIMVRQKAGRIVNIASVMGVVPARLQCAYTSAKAGVVNLTKTMAIELAPSNILVNAVCPGTMENVYWSGSILKGVGSRILKHVPLGRPGTFEDIANAVTFLVAPESSYITGQALCVDGGWTVGGFCEESSAETVPA